MRYAICNETFGSQPFPEAWAEVCRLGYEGIEIAPFTLFDEGATIDVRELGADRRVQIRQQAADAGLEIVGLHWLLAKTTGFYLTSADPDIRRETADYFCALADLCGDLGGEVLVLGSPQQRNLLPGVSYEEACEYAAEVLRAVMPTCRERNVVVALEPLGPAEGDFLLTAAAAAELAEMVDSPHCRLHLDVKAMASEGQPIPDI
ncbi:MAG: sugar phosphate isomerase/epimerase, partial [Planctomycetales bacterium]|nr:sugar phosphate isomerase/epimerase [Planctomycetales bacterium]